MYIFVVINETYFIQENQSKRVRASSIKKCDKVNQRGSFFLKEIYVHRRVFTAADSLRCDVMLFLC